MLRFFLWSLILVCTIASAVNTQQKQAFSEDSIINKQASIHIQKLDNYETQKEETCSLCGTFTDGSYTLKVKGTKYDMPNRIQIRHDRYDYGTFYYYITVKNITKTHIDIVVTNIKGRLTIAGHSYYDCGNLPFLLVSVKSLSCSKTEVSNLVSLIGTEHHVSYEHSSNSLTLNDYVFTFQSNHGCYPFSKRVVAYLYYIITLLIGCGLIFLFNLKNIKELNNKE